MSNFPSNLDTALDIALSESGDLLISETGDLDTVSGVEAFQQDIFFRLKTHAGDYYLRPACGASLDTLIGQANSEATGNIAKTLILNALTHDGFLTEDSIDITVFPTPQDPNSITIIIDIDLSTRFSYSTDSNNTILSIALIVDLQEGLLL